jgi:chromosome segregation ATPase
VPSKPEIREGFIGLTALTNNMKPKTATILLAIICLGLGLGMIFQQTTAVKAGKEAETQQNALKKKITEQNIVLDSSGKKLEVLEKNNRNILSKLEKTGEALKTRELDLSHLAKSLEDASKEAELAEKKSQEELGARNQKIRDLEEQNDQLNQEKSGFELAIDDLQNRIVATMDQLESAEGDREFLLVELKRLNEEKNEMERQLSNLDLLKEQLSKLKKEISIQKRLGFLKKGLIGIFSKKGGQRLKEAIKPRIVTTNYDLNVEIKRSGEVETPSTEQP